MLWGLDYVIGAGLCYGAFTLFPDEAYDVLIKISVDGGFKTVVIGK